MNLFDFTLTLNGFPLKRAKKRLSDIQNRSDSEFDTYVEQKKQEILDFHLNHNTFYQGFCSGKKIQCWEDVPILKKSDFQIPLEERLSEGFSKTDVYINKTSGSSGDPFIFAKDKFSHALTWAVIQDRFGWYGLNFNKSLQARFYGIPLDKKGHLKERVKDALSHRLRFSVFDLGDEAFEKVLKKFGRTEFDYINGYTSAVVQFAKFLAKKQIVLTDVCGTLKACVVTSEMLFDSDKILMQRQFGVPIINEYGASELDLIAFENPDGQWQINNETLFVEVVDSDNRVLPNGKEGRIVITSLFNRAHPFIRYDIGDIGKLSEKSTFKKPLLESLMGRTNDLIYLPSGKIAAGLTFYYVTKSIIENDGNVKEFVITQSKKGKFEIDYVSETELSEEKKGFIIKEIHTYLEEGLHIDFNRKDIIPRSEGGKLKQFKSLIKTNG